MRGLPLAYPGMRIGLFGGSFDPAHEGHAHVAETALQWINDMVAEGATAQQQLDNEN